MLTGSIGVPDAVAPLDLRADLRTRRVIAKVTLVEAPGEGRPLSRINWLLRQVADTSGDLRIEVGFQGTRETTSLLLVEPSEPVEPDPPASADPPPFVAAETREVGEAQEPPATPVTG